MRDYRFDMAVAGVRDSTRSYCFSLEASEELSRNDAMGAKYSAEMWEEFYTELEREWEHYHGSNKPT